MLCLMRQGIWLPGSAPAASLGPDLGQLLFQPNPLLPDRDQRKFDLRSCGLRRRSIKAHQQEFLAIQLSNQLCDPIQIAFIRAGHRFTLKHSPSPAALAAETGSHPESTSPQLGSSSADRSRYLRRRSVAIRTQVHERSPRPSHALHRRRAHVPSAEPQTVPAGRQDRSTPKTHSQPQTRQYKTQTAPPNPAHPASP